MEHCFVQIGFRIVNRSRYQVQGLASLVLQSLAFARCVHVFFHALDNILDRLAAHGGLVVLAEIGPE